MRVGTLPPEPKLHHGGAGGGAVAGGAGGAGDPRGRYRSGRCRGRSGAGGRRRRGWQRGCVAGHTRTRTAPVRSRCARRAPSAERRAPSPGRHRRGGAGQSPDEQPSHPITARRGARRGVSPALQLYACSGAGCDGSCSPPGSSAPCGPFPLTAGSDFPSLSGAFFLPRVGGQRLQLPRAAQHACRTSTTMEGGVLQSRPHPVP